MNASRRAAFQCPPVPTRLVERPRLYDVLERSRGSPITLVTATPGAGKTVLLSDWCRRQPDPVAWVTTGNGDNEPGRFWATVCAAVLRARGPGVAGEPAPPVADRVEFVRILRRVADSGMRMILVLDDAHTVTHPKVLDDLDAVVNDTEHSLRLIAAARRDPLLPLPRYRLAGTLTELREADLAMTADEARQLLAAHRVRLSPDQLDTLLTRTEGWTGGLRLSALRMEGAADAARFVSEFAVDRGSIGEYLVSEVLDRLSPQMRRILTDTSFLDEVDGDVADAVTGLEGCGAMLDDLAQSNSFVIPLDASHTRFRCHQLFRELLQHRFAMQPRHHTLAVYGRAAAHYERRQELPEAIRWGLRAGEETRVARLLTEGGLAKLFVADPGLAGSGLDASNPAADAVPEDRSSVLDHSADLLRAGRCAATADAAAAARALTALQMRDPAARPCVPRCEAHDVAELVIAYKAGDFGAVESVSRRSLGRIRSGRVDPVVPGLDVAILAARSLAEFWSGGSDESMATLDQVISRARRERALPALVALLSTRAILDCYEGRWRRVTAQLADIRSLLTDDHQRADADPMIHLVEACRAQVTGDFRVMDEHIARAGAHESGMSALVFGIVTCLQVESLVAAGHIGDATERLRQVAEAEWPQGILTARIIGAAGMACAAAGHPNRGRRIIERYASDDEFLYVAVPLARIQALLGDIGAAQDSVRAVIGSMSPRVSRVGLVDAFLCDAEIALRAGDDSRSLELISDAMDLAGEGIALPFIGSHRTFERLLARHPATAERWFACGGPSLAPNGSMVHFERNHPLTKRESAILRLLTTSMSAADIAAELCVSTTTVKTHIGAVYRKLSVHSRREAIDRARQMQIL